MMFNRISKVDLFYIAIFGLSLVFLYIAMITS
jgi:hypothetical protein